MFILKLKQKWSFIITYNIGVKLLIHNNQNKNQDDYLTNLDIITSLSLLLNVSMCKYE